MAHGGAKAISLVLVIRWIAAALTAPWLAYFADRYPRERVMLAADLSRVASGMAFRAGARAGLAFTAYHAGFGWGAWAMTLAAVALSLGVVVSLLRWLDERKGYAT